MQALKNEHGISIIYITHDLATAYHVSDYVLVLHDGRKGRLSRYVARRVL